MGKQHLSLMTSSRCGRCWIKSIKRHRQFEQMFLQKSSSLINKAQQSTPKRDWSGLPHMETNIVGSDFTDFFFFWVFMEWHTHDSGGNVMVEASLCSALNEGHSKAHSWDSLCPALPNRLLGAGFSSRKWLYIKSSIGTIYPVPTPFPISCLEVRNQNLPDPQKAIRDPPFATLTGIPPFRHPAMLFSVSHAGVWTVLKAPTPVLFPLCLSMAL